MKFYIPAYNRVGGYINFFYMMRWQGMVVRRCPCSRNGCTTSTGRSAAPAPACTSTCLDGWAKEGHR